MAAIDNSIDPDEGNIKEEGDEVDGDVGGRDASGRSGGADRPLTAIAVINHVTIDEVGECREDHYRRQPFDASLLH